MNGQGKYYVKAKSHSERTTTTYMFTDVLVFMLRETVK